MAHIHASGTEVRTHGGFWAREYDGRRIELKLHGGAPASLRVAALLVRSDSSGVSNRLVARMNVPVDASTLNDLTATVRGGAFTPSRSLENERDVILGTWNGVPGRNVTVELSNRSSSAGLRSERGAYFQQEYADLIPTGILSHTFSLTVITANRDNSIRTYSTPQVVILRREALAVHRLDTAAALAISNVTSFGTPVETFHVSHASHTGDVYLTISAAARWYLGHDGALILPWSGTRTESEADLTAAAVPANGGVSGNNYPSINGVVQNTIRNLPSGAWVMYAASWDRIAAAASSLFTVGTDRTIRYEPNTKLYNDALTADDGWAVEMASDTNAYHTGPNFKHASGRDRGGVRAGGMRLLVTVPGASYGLGTAYRGTSNPVVIHPDSELHWFGVEMAFIDNNDVNTFSELRGIAMGNALSDVDLTIRSTPREPGDPTFRVMRAWFGRMTHGAGRRLDITLVDTACAADDVHASPFAPSSLVQVDGQTRNAGTLASLSRSGGAELTLRGGVAARRATYTTITGYAPTVRQGAIVIMGGGFRSVALILLNPTLDLAALNFGPQGGRVDVDVEVTCVNALGAAEAGVPVIVRSLVDSKYAGTSVATSASNPAQANGTGTTGADGRATIRRAILSSAQNRASLTDGTSARIRVRDSRYTLVDRAVTLAAAGVNRFTVQVARDAEAPAALPSGASATINGGEKEVAVNGNVSMSPRQLYGILKRDLPDDVLPFFSMSGNSLTLDADWDVRFSIPRTSGLASAAGDSSNRLILRGTGAYDGTIGDGMYVNDATRLTVRLATGQAGATVVHSKVDSRILLLVADGTTTLKAWTQATPDAVPARAAASDIDVSAVVAAGESVRGMTYVPERRAILLALWDATASTARIVAVSPLGASLGASTFTSQPGTVNSICHIDARRLAIAHQDGANWRLDTCDTSDVFASRPLTLAATILPTGPQEILSVAWTGTHLLLVRMTGPSVLLHAYVGLTLSGPAQAIGSAFTDVRGAANLVEVDRSRPSHLYLLRTGSAPLTHVDYADGTPTTWTARTNRYLPGLTAANAMAITAFRDTQAVGEVVETTGTDGIVGLRVPVSERASERGVTVKKAGYNPVHEVINPSVPDHAVSLSLNTDIDTSIDISDYDLTASGGDTKNIYVALGTTAADTEIRFSDTYDLKASPEKSKRLLDAVMSTEDGVKFLHRYYEAPSPNNMGRVFSIHPTFVNILPGWIAMVRKAGLPANSRAVFGVAAYTGDDETFYRPAEKNGGHVEIADPVTYIQFDTPRIRAVSQEVISEPANREAIADAVLDAVPAGAQDSDPANTLTVEQILYALRGGPGSGGGGGLDDETFTTRLISALGKGTVLTPFRSAVWNAPQTPTPPWSADTIGLHLAGLTTPSATLNLPANLPANWARDILRQSPEAEDTATNPATSLGRRIADMDAVIEGGFVRDAQDNSRYNVRGGGGASASDILGATPQAATPQNAGTVGRLIADGMAKAKRLDFAGASQTGEADLKVTLDGEDVRLAATDPVAEVPEVPGTVYVFGQGSVAARDAQALTSKSVAALSTVGQVSGPQSIEGAAYHDGLIYVLNESANRAQILIWNASTGVQQATPLNLILWARGLGGTVSGIAVTDDWIVVRAANALRWWSRRTNSEDTARRVTLSTGGTRGGLAAHGGTLWELNAGVYNIAAYSMATGRRDTSQDLTISRSDKNALAVTDTEVYLGTTGRAVTRRARSAPDTVLATYTHPASVEGMALIPTVPGVPAAPARLEDEALVARAVGEAGISAGGGLDDTTFKQRLASALADSAVIAPLRLAVWNALVTPTTPWLSNTIGAGFAAIATAITASTSAIGTATTAINSAATAMANMATSLGTVNTALGTVNTTLTGLPAGVWRQMRAPTTAWAANTMGWIMNKFKFGDSDTRTGAEDISASVGTVTLPDNISVNAVSLNAQELPKIGKAVSQYVAPESDPDPDNSMGKRIADIADKADDITIEEENGEKRVVAQTKNFPATQAASLSATERTAIRIEMEKSGTALDGIKGKTDSIKFVTGTGERAVEAEVTNEADIANEIKRATPDATASPDTRAGSLQRIWQKAATEAEDAHTGADDAHTDAQAAATDARIARKMLTNRQVRDPTTSMLTTYDDDGTTVFRTHGLKRRDGASAAGAEAFEREDPPQADDEAGQ